MVKIKDRLTLAAVSSAIAHVPPRLINYVERRYGYSDIHYDELIASLFLPNYKSNNRISQYMGVVGNVVNGAIMATVITYSTFAG